MAGKEVSLILKLDNSEFIKGMRAAQEATSKLYETIEKNSNRTKGLIEKEIQMQDQLKARREKASDIDNIKIYNKLLDDSKKRLNDLETAGIKAEKQSKNFLDSLLKMGVAYLGLNTIVKGLKETVFAFFTKSQEGLDLLERKVSNLKASFGVLRGELIKLGNSMAGDSGNKATKFGNIMVGVLQTLVTTANVIPKVRKYFDDLKGKMNEAGAAAEEYTRKQQELEDAEIAMIKPRSEANLKLTEARRLYAEGAGTLAERIKYLDQAIDIETKATDAEVKHQEVVVKNIQDVNALKKKNGDLTREDMLKEALAIAKLDELREDSYRKQIRLAGELKAAKLQARKEGNTVSPLLPVDSGFDISELPDILKKITKFHEDLQKVQDDSIHASGERAKKENKQINADNDQADEDRKKRIEEGLAVTLQLLGDFESLSSSLYDRQYSKIEKQYRFEMKAAGDNEKAKAAAEERFAKKKAELDRKAAKTAKEFALFRITIETAAGIAKALPNLVLAAIAATIGAVQLATVAAKPLPVFARGGFTGAGKQRDSTGERIAGVVHEREFVVNRYQTQKFRDVLEAINRDDKRAIYNSFQKLDPRLVGGTTVNNVSVENSGPNKRLDKLIAVNEAMKAEIQQLKSKGQPEYVTETATSTIYKKGNSIRRVKK